MDSDNGSSHSNRDGHFNSQDGNRPFKPHRDHGDFHRGFGSGRSHSRGGFGRRFNHDGDSDFGRKFERDGEERPPRRDGGFGHRFERDGEGRPPRRDGGFGHRFERDGEGRPPRRDGGFGHRFERDGEGRPPRRDGGFGHRFERDGESNFGRRFERDSEKNSFIADSASAISNGQQSADTQQGADAEQGKPTFYRDHSSHVSENILLQALNFLSRWENIRISLDDCLDDLRESKFREKAAVASLLFEYFRHKDFLDALLAKHAQQEHINQDMRLLISLAATQVFFQTGIAKQSAVNIAVDVGKMIRGYGGGSFVNAMLRTYLRDPDINPEQISVVCPPLLMERWTAQYGEDKAKEIGSLFASNPPLCVRLTKGIDPEVLAPYDPTPVEPDFNAGEFKFYELNSPAGFFESELLMDGKAYVQDPATAMGISLVDPAILHGNIIDLCAAPGGKTIMISELAEPHSNIIAADRSQARVFRMKVNLRRAGLKIHTVEADAREIPYSNQSFDFVLADVPCTNTGVIRRRPDVPWRFNKTRLEEITPLQLEILNSAANLTRTGGYVLYSTCSLEDEENGGRIRVFLRQHPGWELVKECTLFPTANHDGAYSALLHCIEQIPVQQPEAEEEEAEPEASAQDNETVSDEQEQNEL